MGVLEHLQQARAYRIARGPAKAMAAYSDFFKLWDTADRDIQCCALLVLSSAA